MLGPLLLLVLLMSVKLSTLLMCFISSYMSGETQGFPDGKLHKWPPLKMQIMS